MCLIAAESTLKQEFIEGEMMHILVAGGAGAVGSKLVPELLKKGYEVTVFDLYPCGAVLEKHPKLTEVKGDVRNLMMVERALLGINAVVYLVASADELASGASPEFSKSVNLDAFEPFVKAAKELGVERFIYMSSALVYGSKSLTKIHEKIKPEPQTEFAKFKALCEKILLKHQSSDFITSIFRPLVIRGDVPSQRADSPVNLLTQLSRHMGAVHVNDVVCACLAALEASSEKIQGEIFNLGDEESSCVFCNKIKEVLGVVPQYGCSEQEDCLK